MQRVVFTRLEDHRATSRRPTADDPSPMPTDANTGRYEDATRSFAWVSSTGGPQAELADDVVDAVRALRAADVLRQRGTTLRTSGGFELYVDSRNAMAVCTLRPETRDAAYVITYDDDRAAGEANVRVAFITPQGDLRIAFHRGGFASDAATHRAAASVADVVEDIVADVIPSFSGRFVGDGLRAPTCAIDDMQIQLERPGDRPDFAVAVATLVAEHVPSLAHRLVVVADVEGAAPEERDRYYAAELVEASGSQADDVLRGMLACGVDTSSLERAVAFSEVRRAVIQPGEMLVRRGSPPAFVYVPMAAGLEVRPDGGYAPSPLHPWIPVGTTGVIRRAGRNAAIVAELEVAVIMIPADLYQEVWLRPLSVDELVSRMPPAPAAAASA
jgi:hypothetical protein